MRSYKELEVWKKAVDFVESIYAITINFPVHENSGIVSQMRRASISIPSNIAEGSVRKSKAEFARFINIARGSAAELETQLIITYRLKYISEDKLNEMTKKIDEISKMLYGLRNSLETRN
jgi:four helix bundle protein